MAFCIRTRLRLLYRVLTTFLSTGGLRWMPCLISSSSLSRSCSSSPASDTSPCAIDWWS